MKILWVNNLFLHPANKGGLIRTLEMLRRLHKRHEIHYVAFSDPDQPESVTRSSEYCTRAYPVHFRIASKLSLRSMGQIGASLLSPIPLLVIRKRSKAMRRLLIELLNRENFDSLLCDFLTPSINVPELHRWVLFQHNVETVIWRRYAQTAPDPFRRWYFQFQAERLFQYEQKVCRTVGRVVAVSEVDASLMREIFGVGHISAIPTGVDLDHFAPPEAVATTTDLVFVGSMDWLPNIDAVTYFVNEILPLIRRRQPDCSLAIVGRTPPPEIIELARRDPLIVITSTVPDIRPYLWRAKVSVVPLRIGGGTRLKIYESMAARVPVVSTSVGAEGLVVHPEDDIYVADTPESFAARCVELLESPSQRQRMTAAAWRLVSDHFSWDQVTERFEEILQESLSRKPVAPEP